MKNIFNLYEGILDDDTTVAKDIRNVSLTIGEVNDWFKDHLPELYDRWNDHARSGKKSSKVHIEDDGSIVVDEYLNGSLTITEDLPDFITFKKFSYLRDNPLRMEGDKITSLRGLPDDLVELDVIDCPNLKNFDDAPKTCGYLKVVNCPNIKSLRGLPKCKNIRFKNCPSWNVKQISKFTNTKKSNIIVL